MRRALWGLAPLSAALIYAYHLALSLKQKKPFNIPTLIYTFRDSVYESLAISTMYLLVTSLRTSRLCGGSSR
ncbi:MAG: hypothetical protein NDP21_06145 [Crenarchaeota archaeon]|nr:hypothetical protein [Thermoproteota archaeon]